MKVKEMSWTAFRDFDHKQTIIIPLGATEVYGPHMPLGSDIIVSEEIANLVADRLNALVGPSLEVGDSLSLQSFPGTLTVRPESFKNYLEDICKSFIKWGFNKIFFLNSHVYNVAIIKQISLKLREEYGVTCASADLWRMIVPYCDGVTQYEGTMAHGHAAEAGTSVMLYLRPELVHMEHAVCTPEEYIEPYPDIITHIPFDRYTHTGTLGDATVATAEKGRIIVDRCVNRIVEFIQNEFWRTGDDSEEVET